MTNTIVHIATIAIYWAVPMAAQLTTSVTTPITASTAAKPTAKTACPPGDGSQHNAWIKVSRPTGPPDWLIELPTNSAWSFESIAPDEHLTIRSFRLQPAIIDGTWPVRHVHVPGGGNRVRVALWHGPVDPCTQGGELRAFVTTWERSEETIFRNGFEGPMVWSSMVGEVDTAE